MLNHLWDQEGVPSRVVILGGHGFIGSEICKKVKEKKIPILNPSKTECDLSKSDAPEKLKKSIRPDDVLVFVAAQAPCKDIDMFLNNIQMVKNVAQVIADVGIDHVVYVSSDAVYSDSKELITEKSCASPTSLHGIMHLSREIVLKQVCENQLAIVRPTLIYGLNDPHNGYGPNRFRRLAAEGNEIVLFGGGEELRDHVSVEDVAELVVSIIGRRSVGVVNAVSGEVVSFLSLAEFTGTALNINVKIQKTPRVGIIPHNGYRAFDSSALRTAFPNLRFRSWADGVGGVIKDHLRYK